MVFAQNETGRILSSAIVTPLPSSDNLPTYSSGQVVASEDKLVNARIIQELQSMKADILTQLTANNDQNYLTLDTRNREYMRDVSKKVIVGILGLNLLVSGIAGALVIYLDKRNSAEALERRLTALSKKKADDDRVSLQLESLNAQMSSLRQALVTQRPVQASPPPRPVYQYPAAGGAISVPPNQYQPQPNQYPTYQRPMPQYQQQQWRR